MINATAAPGRGTGGPAEGDRHRLDARTEFPGHLAGRGGSRCEGGRRLEKVCGNPVEVQRPADQVNEQRPVNIPANLLTCLSLLNHMTELLEARNEDLRKIDLEDFGIGLILTNELDRQLSQERIGHHALVGGF